MGAFLYSAARFCLHTLKWQPSEFRAARLFDMQVCLLGERQVQKVRSNSGNRLSRKKVLELEKMLKESDWEERRATQD